MAKKQPTPRLFKIIRRIIFGSIALGAIGFSFLVFMAASDLPPLNDLENPKLNLSTQIFTADGKLLGSFHSDQNRVYAELHEISTHVIDALIATEDIRFYNHCGVDPKTLLALVYRNFVKGTRSGGSTLTMQLARNLYDKVGRERTIYRKMKEIIVATILEKNFTKEEIILAYLNTTSFYGNTYGIELGSKTLFGKSASELDIHEAALMIGLLQNPTYHNPINHEERATHRRNVVLFQMEHYGFLSMEEKEARQAMPLGLDFHPSYSQANLMSFYFKQHVSKYMQQWIKKKGKHIDLYKDGLKVYTTIDSRMQAHAESAIHQHLAAHQQTFYKDWKNRTKPWVKNPKVLDRAIKRTQRYNRAKNSGASQKEIDEMFDEKQEMRIWSWSGSRDTTLSPRDSVIYYMQFLETGFLSMEPQTGHIKAWVGGINFRHFQYDHVFQGKRQVGSTFKPFVYTTAFEDNLIQPCDRVLDMDVTIDLPDGKKWTPQNSGGKDDGIMTYMEGLAKSKNKVTASLMKKLGPKRVCKMAKQMGIQSELDCVPSLCLGTTDLSVYEMVSSYCAFANAGVNHEPQFITRIEDRNGTVLEEFKTEPKQVINPHTAFTMSTMLMNVVDHLSGTAHSLRSKYKFENQIGGKTGTTQNQSDGWFMGITPELVSGVWVGCSDREMHFPTIRNGQGARMALPIWALYMQRIYADPKIGIEPTQFVKPEGYVGKFVCPKPEDEKDPDDLPWGL